jgi:hypothetical protein
VRNGGFPDWLLQKKIPLRRNDPQYLKYVGAFYNQIGGQLKGMMWQDGGPILGVQIENEYAETGPGAGAEHLAQLKRMAIAAGIDPPLFSVTGWPGHDIPVHEVVPVTGAYPDDFWTTRTVDEPPNPVYLFSTDRALTDLGAMSVGDPAGKLDLNHYPFFAAEQGGGMEPSYHRRPLLDSDDISALAVSALGSGVNLYGYYMFHGGSNPVGKLTTLQESLATGYPNDLPVISYDYQAPIGEYGQERDSFRALKMLHLFLQSFGSQLAEMTPYAPDAKPRDAADASLPRLMLRANGDHGFLFVNNYVRKLDMPARSAFQVRLKLPGGTLNLPDSPVGLPANSHFILPVNLDVGAGTLRYSTAQLLTRMDVAGRATYFFFSIPGVAPGFSFDAESVATVHTDTGVLTRGHDSIFLQGLHPGKDTTFQVTGRNGQTITIFLLTQELALQFWQLRIKGSEIAMLSPADVFADDFTVHLRSTNPAYLSVSEFVTPLNQAASYWQERCWDVQPRLLTLHLENTQNAAPTSKPQKLASVPGRDMPLPTAPSDDDFDHANTWSLVIPEQSTAGLSEIYLHIDYTGDVGRLSSKGHMLDDNFFDGRPWDVGLKRFLPGSFDAHLQLTILPFLHTDHIYLDAQAWRRLEGKAKIASVSGLELRPEYEVLYSPSSAH